jgi:sulfonate transport system permease protein
VFRAIVLPGSIPVLLHGIRIAVVMALRGVVMAELIASTVGVGFLLRSYGDHFRTGQIFALILLIALVGVAADAILRAAQKRFEPWRPGKPSAALPIQ